VMEKQKAVAPVVEDEFDKAIRESEERERQWEERSKRMEASLGCSSRRCGDYSV